MCERLEVELCERLQSGELRPLPYRRVPASRVGDAMRQMSQGRHMGRIVIDMTDPAVRVRPPHLTHWRLRDDATYLVTGGFSGLGLEFARTAVRHGVRSLILVGRSGATTEQARCGVAEMRAAGARVFEAKADVAEFDRLRRLVNEALNDEDEMPPLRGVFHAAMVLDDGLTTEIDAERFRRPMRPKVAGGWNLHRLTRDMELDFFILCSSVAAVVGSLGQASYAAGTAFLDSLAHYRRSRGLPALSINWGVLGEFGVVARDENLSAYFASRGLEAIAPRTVFEIMRLALARDAVQVGAVRVDWGRLSATLSPHRDRIRRKLEDVVDEDRISEAASGFAANVLDQLRSLDREARVAVVAGELSRQVGNILGQSQGHLDMDQPLSAMGLDSLMVVELQAQLDNELGVWLPSSKFGREPTILSLSAALYEDLMRRDEPATA